MTFLGDAFYTADGGSLPFGSAELVKLSEETVKDEYLLDLLFDNPDARSALETHLVKKPKSLSCTYDNIDGNSKSSDFVMGDEKENSYHWCSSVIFEDHINADDISDSKVPPSILEVPVEERMCVTAEENEHLLQNYTLFVMNLIRSCWPGLFPTMKTTKFIPHQYSEILEEEVKCWVGPLVFEDESTISGTS